MSERNENNTDETTYRNISVNGSYAESVAGDVINVQGHTINFINQDLSGFLSDINQILENLKSQGSTIDAARSSLMNELAHESRKNPRFKKKLVKWRKRISSNLQEILDKEAASVIIEIPLSSSWRAIDKEMSLDKTIYETLENLLKFGDWEEADKETSIVIINVLTSIYGEEFPDLLQKNITAATACYIWELEHIDCNIDGLSSDNIIDIPRKDLQYIDHLWKKYSGGKFGFSVQKTILIKMLENSGYPASMWWRSELDIKSFGELIGWYRNSYWIYYSDIGFSGFVK